MIQPLVSATCALILIASAAGCGTTAPATATTVPLVDRAPIRAAVRFLIARDSPEPGERGLGGYEDGSASAAGAGGDMVWITSHPAPGPARTEWRGRVSEWAGETAVVEVFESSDGCGVSYQVTVRRTRDGWAVVRASVTGFLCG